MDNYTIVEFEKDIRLCIKQIYELGYKDIKKNSFQLSFNKRLNKTLGRCIKLKEKDTFKIELSSNYVNKVSREEIINTVMHEVIHSLPNSFDHQANWKKIANHINESYGYNIKRCADSSSYSSHLDDKTKYIITCKGCKTNFKRMKMGNFVKSVLLNNRMYKCRCGCKDFDIEVKF